MRKESATSSSPDLVNFADNKNKPVGVGVQFDGPSTNLMIQKQMSNA